MSEKWIAYSMLNKNNERSTMFCRGEDLDNPLNPYEIADKLNQLEAENDALKRENERLKTYASTLLELALDDIDLPLLTAEEEDGDWLKYAQDFRNQTQQLTTDNTALKRKVGVAYWKGHTNGRLWGEKPLSRDGINRGMVVIDALLTAEEAE